MELNGNFNFVIAIIRLLLGKSRKPVMTANGTRNISIQEIENIFGFPRNYTDTRNLNTGMRLQLLGKAWSVPCVAQIISTLKKYFEMKGDSKIL